MLNCVVIYKAGLIIKLTGDFLNLGYIGVIRFNNIRPFRKKWRGINWILSNVIILEYQIPKDLCFVNVKKFIAAAIRIVGTMTRIVDATINIDDLWLE